MKVSIPFELDGIQALRLLVRVLDMENLTCSEEPLYIHGGKVCRKDENGEYVAVDERADLFAALRNVINALIPNCDFRSDPYITHYYDGEDDKIDDYTYYEIWNTTSERNRECTEMCTTIEIAKAHLATSHCDWCRPVGTGTIYGVVLVPEDDGSIKKYCTEIYRND